MTQHGTRMELSLTQASREAGVSKSTIHRSIKSGRLSATRHEDGSYSIAPSELFRVFPRNPDGIGSMTQHGTHEGTPKNPSPPPPDQAALLQVKVDMLTAQLEREKETVEDLRRRLDRADDRLLALSPLRPPEVKSKNWWQWIRGVR